MKSPASNGLKRFRTALALALLLLASGGCAGHLAEVKSTSARLPTFAGNDERLARARQCLAAAERERPLASLGNDLSAARLSLNVLKNRPDDPTAQSIYNFAVARTVQNCGRASLEPWRQPITITNDQSRYVLTTRKPADPDHDPSRYDLFPTDALKIGGTLFRTRARVSGIGAPLVAVGRTENPRSREQFKLRRVYAPVTAVLKFSDKRTELELVDPMGTERVSIGSRSFPLATDFSAPTAMLIAHDRPERLGFSRVMNPEKYANTARLCQLQQYDPNRTPVVFVHGLQETGASWVPMIDTLRDNSWIREHYQFWFFSYPSGYPYPYSAALFRRDLDGIDRAFPNHKRVVLIGHSMGGMICRLMITDARDRIWRDLFRTPPAKTPLTGDARKLLEESFIFVHRPEVRRVIFISTPHRGSNLATSWIGRIGSGFVRTPQFFTPVYASMKPLLIADPAAQTFKRMPNSVDTLEPNDRFVRAVNKLPLAPGIPYHSIMGDRGRGDTPNSSDGIVPYWSSHLDGAQSELIVNSDHGAQYNPQAIREVERILKENLTGASQNW